MASGQFVVFFSIWGRPCGRLSFFLGARTGIEVVRVGRLSRYSLPRPTLASRSGLDSALKWAAVEMLTILVLRMSKINDFALGVDAIEVFNFFRPFGAGSCFSFYPGLTPWAAFLRRFAAGLGLRAGPAESLESWPWL